MAVSPPQRHTGKSLSHGWSKYIYCCDVCNGKILDGCKDLHADNCSTALQNTMLF